MLRKLSAALLLLVTLTYTILPVCAAPYEFRADARFRQNMRVDGTTTHAGPVVNSGATTLTGNTSVGGTLSVTGAVSLTVPLTAANANNSLSKKVFTIPVVNGTIADAGVYTVTVPVMRAGTVTGIKATIGTVITGGTNTVAITKNGSTTLLSTATVDPTTFAANTATSLTLTGTGASLAFAAGDVIKIVHTAGTQTQDGVGEGFAIEYATTDF